MEQDFGVRIGADGRMTAADVSQYRFGTGDFSITVLVQSSQPGTVVSKKSAAGGSPACAGWLVVLKPDGVIKFATDNGFGFYEVNSIKTCVFDGAWHGIAAVRRNGELEIWLDGEKLAATPRSSLPTPLDVSGQTRLMIGGTDQTQEPYNQLIGYVEDITIWDRAISEGEIVKSMFNLIKGDEAGLCGFWELNENWADSSPVGNALQPHGDLAFVPVFHAVWTEGKNSFAFMRIDTHQDPGAVKARAKRSAVETANRTQYLDVAPGAPLLIGVSNDVVTYLDYPDGLQVKVTSPSGEIYDTDSNTEDLYAVTVHGSVYQLIVKDPEPGSWKVEIAAPVDLAFQFSMQTLPSGADAFATMSQALAEVYPQFASADPPPSGYSAQSFAVASIAMAALQSDPPQEDARERAALLFGFLVAAVVVAVIGIGYEIYWTTTKEANLGANSGPADFGKKASGRKTPAEVWKAVRDKVGDPATTNPANFVTRADMGIDDSFKLQLDVGGEGYHHLHGVESGFSDALNLNAQTHDSQRPNVDIPMLVHVNDWSTDPPYPFADGTVDYITMQGAPLTDHNVDEMARVVRKGGEIAIWMGHGDFPTQLANLAAKLNTTPVWSDSSGSTCSNEFKDTFPEPKVCLHDNR